VEDAETLTEMQWLLSRYQGVEVELVRSSPSAIRIVLCAQDQKALAQLARCADGANVPFHCWIRGPGQLEQIQADPRDLRYEFRIPHDPSGREPPSYLQTLGNFLVWDLGTRGLITQVAAFRLLNAWGGCRARAKRSENLDSHRQSPRTDDDTNGGIIEGTDI
jgi:hypothetical protein